AAGVLENDERLAVKPLAETHPLEHARAERIELRALAPGAHPRHDLADALLGEGPREVGRVDAMRDLSRRASGIDAPTLGVADARLARPVEDPVLEDRGEVVIADIPRPQGPVAVEGDGSPRTRLREGFDRGDRLSRRDRLHAASVSRVPPRRASA